MAMREKKLKKNLRRELDFARALTFRMASLSVEKGLNAQGRLLRKTIKEVI